MLDVAVAYNRYKFLGEEFLTWLWYIIEKNQRLLRQFDQEVVALEVGNRIVFENRRRESAERITIKGEGAGLEEGTLALKNGALVTELNMVYRSAQFAWHFTLKGESLNVSNLKVPQTDVPETDDDLEGVVLEKLYLYDRPLQFIRDIFAYFIKLRISNNWKNIEVPVLRKWIQTS